MPFPTPRLLAAQAIMRTADPLGPDDYREEKFIAALGEEFPRILNRQRAGDLPPQFPHLTLGSSSSQLAVAQAQVDFNVGFYGELVESPAQARGYLERKLRAIYDAFGAIDESVSMFAVIATLQFSATGTDIDPVGHMLQAHLRTGVPAAEVQDAESRIALRLRDTYYANLTLKNYELKQVLRPVNPMAGPVVIRPWEGTVTDHGWQLLVDINNNLEAQTRRENPVVTDVGLGEALRILDDFLAGAGAGYVETGSIDISDLAGAGQ